MNASALPLRRRLPFLLVLLAGFLLAIAPTVSASGIHRWEPVPINYDHQSNPSIIYDDIQKSSGVSQQQALRQSAVAAENVSIGVKSQQETKWDRI